MNNSKRNQCKLALLIFLIVSVSFGYVGGCAKGKDDSREESPASSGSTKEEEKLNFELQKRMVMLRDQHKAIGIQELVKTYGYQVVPAAEPYLSDSERLVRLAAKMLIRRAGLMSKDKWERQMVVEELLDYGLQNPERKDGIFYDLLPFQAADYSDAV